MRYTRWAGSGNTAAHTILFPELALLLKEAGLGAGNTLMCTVPGSVLKCVEELQPAVERHLTGRGVGGNRGHVERLLCPPSRADAPERCRSRRLPGGEDSDEEIAV